MDSSLQKGSAWTIRTSIRGKPIHPRMRGKQPDPPLEEKSADEQNLNEREADSAPYSGNKCRPTPWDCERARTKRREKG